MRIVTAILLFVIAVILFAIYLQMKKQAKPTTSVVVQPSNTEKALTEVSKIASSLTPPLNMRDYTG